MGHISSVNGVFIEECPEGRDKKCERCKKRGHTV